MAVTRQATKAAEAKKEGITDEKAKATPAKVNKPKGKGGAGVQKPRAAKPKRKTQKQLAEEKAAAERAEAEKRVAEAEKRAAEAETRAAEAERAAEEARLEAERLAAETAAEEAKLEAERLAAERAAEEERLEAERNKEANVRTKAYWLPGDMDEFLNILIEHSLTRKEYVDGEAWGAVRDHIDSFYYDFIEFIHALHSFNENLTKRIPNYAGPEDPRREALADVKRMMEIAGRYLENITGDLGRADNWARMNGEWGEEELEAAFWRGDMQRSVEYSDDVILLLQSEYPSKPLDTAYNYWTKKSIELNEMMEIEEEKARKRPGPPLESARKRRTGPAVFRTSPGPIPIALPLEPQPGRPKAGSPQGTTVSPTQLPSPPSTPAAGKTQGTNSTKSPTRPGRKERRVSPPNRRPATTSTAKTSPPPRVTTKPVSPPTPAPPPPTAATNIPAPWTRDQLKSRLAATSYRSRIDIPTRERFNQQEILNELLALLPIFDDLNALASQCPGDDEPDPYPEPAIIAQMLPLLEALHPHFAILQPEGVIADAARMVPTKKKPVADDLAKVQKYLIDEGDKISKKRAKVMRDRTMSGEERVWRLAELKKDDDALQTRMEMLESGWAEVYERLELVATYHDFLLMEQQAKGLDGWRDHAEFGSGRGEEEFTIDGKRFMAGLA